MSITILLTTIGRDSLIDMINSVRNQLGTDDYLYILVDGEEYHDKVKVLIDKLDTNFKFNFNVIYNKENLGFWGHGIRNEYQKNIKGDYILHGDDDDIYIDGSIDIIKNSIKDNSGKMLLFKFYHDYSNNIFFWRSKDLCLNNIGTPCGLIPNVPDNMGTWSYRYGGDFDFYNTCNFDYVFIDEFIYVVKPRENGYPINDK